MIRVQFGDKECCFDDTGVDPAAPGLVVGALLGGCFYEHKFLAYIASLRLQGVYIDAGAYIGTHALFFARMCSAARVLAFEPRLQVYESLTRNIELNGLTTTILPKSIGLAASATTMQIDLGGQQHDIEVEALDTVLMAEGVLPRRSVLSRCRRRGSGRTPVAVLKIDVEGMELEVLRGAKHLLATDHPWVFAEAHKESQREEIEEFLRPFGYRWTGRVFNASPTYEFAADADRRIGGERFRETAHDWLPPVAVRRIKSMRRRWIERRRTPGQKD